MNAHTPGTGLIERKTAEDIVRHRNKALSLYAEAHAALEAASDALEDAGREANAICPKESPLGINRYNAHAQEEKAKFRASLRRIPRDNYMATARRMLDTDGWAYIIKLTDLDRLMDKKAKDEFNQSLMKDPPELTVETIFATLEQFALQADMVFRRGIAECFTSLDRRFRSHDGWKIGSRVILTYAFNSLGSWNYHRSHDDSLRDIERVFLTLDGKTIPHSGGIVDVVRASRRFGKHQSECENDYFLIRGYKNGNAHIWFKRDDLLERVNKLLGEYYGAPIPEDRDAEPDTGLHDAKTTPAKNYGFFPTPDEAAQRAIEACPLYRRDGEPPIRALEPSAGTGNLARLLVEKGAIVDCVEVQPTLAADLKAANLYPNVYGVDFLRLDPATTGLYDLVCMNPPFDRERDIDHVIHAMKFLKPHGCMVAIMSASTEFRETKKSKAFRDLMATKKAHWNDLPPGSFASVGTYCNTLILKFYNDGTHFYR